MTLKFAPLPFRLYGYWIVGKHNILIEVRPEQFIHFA